jgi:hypothetical protein
MTNFVDRRVDIQKIFKLLNFGWFWPITVAQLEACAATIFTETQLLDGPLTLLLSHSPVHGKYHNSKIYHAICFSIEN